MKRLLLIVACISLQPLSAVSLALSSGDGRSLRRHSVDVYATAKLLDRLKIRAEQCQRAWTSNAAAEEQRLNAAGVAAMNAFDRAVLATTVQKMKEGWSATGNACAQLLAQYYTVKSLLGAKGAPAPNCSSMVCGMDATCEMAPEYSPGGRGASCKCNRCFAGDGFTCIPATCASASYTAARPLLGTPQKVDKRTVRDVSVAIFRDNHVVAAVQLESEGQRGFLRIGRTGVHGVEWGELQSFSGESAAFGPVVTAHDTGRFVVAYRDKDIGGDGYLVGGQIGPGDQLRADFQEPHLFAHEQAQRMVLLPFAASRAVCIYSGHIPITDANPAAQNFGGAVLVHLANNGIVSILGKYRFAHDFRVSRLSATRTSPTSLIVAYRAVSPDPDAEVTTSQELSAAWIGMQGGELSVAQHPLALEPDRREMWGRAVSLISQNLIQYVYQSAVEKKTKMAILRVDPESHELKLMDTPRVIGEGDAEFVQAISLDPGMLMPHTFTYFQHPGQRSSAEVCRVSAQGKVEQCGKAAWANGELQAASGGRLADGRLFFAYADLKGAPFYQIFGAQEFLQQ